MKNIFLLTLVFFCVESTAQRKTENLVIITTDGLRWQELFSGMDSAIANNAKFNEGDSSYIFDTYWDASPAERRKKLMPFTWSMIAKQGQLFGNRLAGCKVNTTNPHWFSYPGYSEIMTGYGDTAINSNSYPPNPHVTVLEFLNKQSRLKGRIAAFGAWNAFDRILNEQRSGIPVFNAFDTVGGKAPTSTEKLLNAMNRDAYKPWLTDECLDVFTHYSAMEWLKTRKPRVLYIAYGETDEWAHSGKYRSYLDAARQVDAWIKEIWDYIQKDPQYRNKTTLFITTDHGRGDIVKDKWTSHGSDIEGAGEIWFAAMGPDTPDRGEVKDEVQLYQNQFAQTFAKLLCYTYTASHPIGNEIFYVFKMKK